MSKFDIGNYGYFDKSSQEPKYDPMGVVCLVCDEPLVYGTTKTISIRADDLRSWFYRVHSKCSNNQEPTESLLDYLDNVKKPRKELDRFLA